MTGLILLDTIVQKLVKVWRYVVSLQSSGNLQAIQIIKKLGGGLQDSYLDEGTLLTLYPST